MRFAISVLFVCAESYAFGQVVLNEFDVENPGIDWAEFIELLGPPNFALDGHCIVLYNGLNDLSYMAIALDGYALDAEGFFVVGGPEISAADLLLPDGNFLQPGTDAIALFAMPASAFPNGTPLLNEDLIDAVVYGTNSPLDAALLNNLTPGSVQVNESAGGLPNFHANARIPNGGAPFATNLFVQQAPTPGYSNVLMCDGGALSLATPSIEWVCTDGPYAPVTFLLSNTTPQALSTLVLVNSNTGLIVASFENTQADFSGLGDGMIEVWGVSHENPLDSTSVLLGQPFSGISGVGCISVSHNSVTLMGVTCAGVCPNFDGDAFCDEFEVAGCMNPFACNFEIQATNDDGSCLIPTGCDFCLGNELVHESDSDLDGVCDSAEVSGCTYGIACNYNPLATDDDGSCLFYCPGCTLLGACNFDSTALQNNGSCVFAADIYGVGFVDCEGQCLHDLDSDGVCDELEIIGCMDAEACNFNPLATDSSDDCEVDGDGDGVCDSEEVMGCMLSTACNFDAAATEAGVCDFVSCAGCTYPYACNFNPQATLSNGTCVFGTCFGCTNPLACNFNPTVGGDDGSCLFENVCGECVSFTPVFTDCEGNCLHDFDGDGICDEEEIAGCTVVSACNFDPVATDENGTCVFAPSGYPCGTSCSGDANENGVDDSTELTNFYAQMENGGCGVWAVWNSELGTCVPNGCSGDFSGDLLVGTADLLVFLSLFGNDCSPQ